MYFQYVGEAALLAMNHVSKHWGKLSTLNLSDMNTPNGPGQFVAIVTHENVPERVLLLQRIKSEYHEDRTRKKLKMKKDHEKFFEFLQQIITEVDLHDQVNRLAVLLRFVKEKVRGGDTMLNHLELLLMEFCKEQLSHRSGKADDPYLANARRWLITITGGNPEIIKGL